ncbi:MAG: DUF4365 domain-containing protein [bacterium]|nr:DUF4365 domain-containing protein [bacterium]
MEAPKSLLTGDSGVGLVQFIVGEQLGWILRPQPHADTGIDAHIEIVQANTATGQLLALQVKSGESWFRESTSDGFIFRPEAKHVRYWLGHSLPVAVVLVDLNRVVAYWQLVTEETVVPTGKNWKITVPKSNRLDASAASVLRAATEADAYTLKLRQLQLARPWMEHLTNGGGLTVKLQEWINKSSGRASLLLTAQDKDGEVVEKHRWPGIFLPGADYSAELLRMFPWASITVDEEAIWERYEADCAIYAEGDLLFYTVDYDKWLEGQRAYGLQPTWDDGEVAHWHLNLDLSGLGRAFLVLDEFLSTEVMHPLFQP